jgi:CheY-like chemotaxis protein
MTTPPTEIGDEYLSQVTHELRGSLNAIFGWAELLRSGPCDDAARVRAAETIIRHARQQMTTIAELIDIWRLATGTLAFSRDSVAILELVQSAVDAVQPIARAKSVRIELEHDSSAEGRARGDRKRLTQAIASLLSNSLHFAPEHSVVAVRLDKDVEDVVRIVIHDHGPSVAPAALPYLFDRQRPPEPIRASPRSTFRLGLSFVRDVITRQGGSIDAESASTGRGLTFRVQIPANTHRALRAATGSAQAPLAEPRGGGVGPPHAVTGLRVLLVDDEPDAREALMGILEHYGAVVRIAGSAEDAISALRDEPFDVLLADIGMPGADGYDLIRSVRTLESDRAAHVPAAAVTAFASDADRRRALAAGYQVHLSKPVDPTALVATVAALGRPAASVR